MNATEHFETTVFAMTKKAVNSVIKQILEAGLDPDKMRIALVVYNSLNDCEESHDSSPFLAREEVRRKRDIELFTTFKFSSPENDA